MMKSFGSKLEIINHFDNLIQQMDIDIEECIEKYNQDQYLGDLSFFKTQERKFKMNIYISIRGYYYLPPERN